MDKLYRYLIIGAGISGITFGRLLQMKGEDNFIILEANSEAGGLCRTKQVRDDVLDIGGGHFLCTKYPSVYNFIFSHIAESEFNYFDRVSKIQLQGHYIDYPIESNIWQLPLDQQVEYLISVIQNGENKGLPQPKNYEEWIRWKLGDLIADSYMLPYNEKIWGIDPNEMDVDWLHKIPRLNIREILIASLKKNADTKKMPSHEGFYYPRSCGFQRIFDAIYAPLKHKVTLNEPVKRLEYCNDYWLINDTYKARTIINTAPWPSLFEPLGSPCNLRDSFQKLRWNSIVVSLWHEEYNHNWHWCYKPDLIYKDHRTFYIHNFAPHSNPHGIYTETNVKRWSDEYLRWENLGKPIYEYKNEYAYPIPTLGHESAIKNIQDYYNRQGLFGLGRWGQWEYLNSDVCIWEAMELIEKLSDCNGIYS